MPSVNYEKDSRIVHLTLNRPDTRNALSGDVIEELVAGLNRANDDADINVVIISGAGKGFSSGGNLTEIKAMTTTDNMSLKELEEWYTKGIQKIPLTIDAIDVVTIAAVHGHAIGAGCDLTAMCDLRIAADTASFSESFLRVGLIPGDGGAWFLPRIIGLARAKEMLFTANPVNANKALQWGLVSEVVPENELLDAAKMMAQNIAGLPPVGVRKAKQLIRKSVTDSLADSLQMAAEMQAELQQLNDHQEAIDSILEKRKPSFSGS
jgi:enoyl-CoA hydratase/carnithine racemase